MTGRRLRDDALAIWKAGVGAVDAGRLVLGALRVAGDRLVVRDEAGRDAASLELAAIGRIAVVGAGKATTTMALAAEEALGADLLASKDVTGWVNVPDATVRDAKRIRVHGARKLPDNRPTEEGVEGSRRIVEIARSLREEDLLIVLISGGGSALLPLPAPGVSLSDKLAVTRLLQERGATIDEMNCVRKHLSEIKGGGLAEATRARVVTLVVSDVIGDPLDVIASGPTAPDPTTFAEAVAVMERHGLAGRAPAPVVERLRAGVSGKVGETPKSVPGRVTNVVVGSNGSSRRAALVTARAMGFAARDLGLREGDTQTAARHLASAVAAEAADGPLCLVEGGETTVDLGGATGKGGRNQEFALAALEALGPEGLAGVCLLSGGTDGEDGPTDAAGAFADEELARAAVAKGLDPADFLRRHDAYNFFDPLGGLVRTGPTNTNVMDLRVVLIDRGARQR